MRCPSVRGWSSKPFFGWWAFSLVLLASQHTHTHTHAPRWPSCRAAQQTKLAWTTPFHPLPPPPPPPHTPHQTWNGTWHPPKVIVVTPSKNYTAADFDVMLQDMGCGKGPKNLYVARTGVWLHLPGIRALHTAATPTLTITAATAAAAATATATATITSTSTSTSTLKEHTKTRRPPARKPRRPPTVAPRARRVCG